MAITVGELNVILDAKTREFQDGLRRANKRLDGFERNVKTSTRNISRSFALVGASVLKLGALIATLFTGAAAFALVRFFGASTKAAGVQEDAIKALDTALSDLGPAAAGVSSSLQAFAAELQKTTRFGDEETISAQALVAAFIKEESAIKGVTAAAADFATARGISIVSAADLLTKSIASSTNALVRYGIEFEGAAGSTERAQAAIDAVTKAFGGQAAAAAKTYTGRIQQLKNAFGDLQEEIGFTITRNPVIIALIRRLTDVFAELATQIANNSDEIGDRFVRAIASALGSLSSLLGTFADTIEAANSLGISFLNIASALAVVSDAVGALVNGLEVFARGVGLAALQDLARKADKVNTVTDLAESFRDLNNQSVGKITRAFVFLQNKVFEAQKEIEQAQQSGASFQIVEGLRKASFPLIAARDKLVDEFARRKLVLPVTADTTLQTAANEALQGFLEAANDTTDEIVSRVERLNTIIETGFRSDKGMVESIRKARDLAAEAQKTVLDFQETFGDDPSPPRDRKLSKQEQLDADNILATQEKITEAIERRRSAQIAAQGPIAVEIDQRTEQITALRTQLEILERINGTEVIRAQLATIIKAETEDQAAAVERLEAARAEERLDKKPKTDPPEVGPVAQGIAASVSAGIREGLTGGGVKGALAAFGDGLARVSEDSLDTAFKAATDGLAKLLQESLPKGLEGLGGAIAGILGTVIGGLLNRGDSSSSSSGNIRSAVTSAQQVRGIVAGPSQIAIAQVGPAIESAFEVTNEILLRIEANTAAFALGITGVSTGSVNTGGTGPATAALANEGPSF